MCDIVRNSPSGDDLSSNASASETFDNERPQPESESPNSQISSASSSSPDDISTLSFKNTSPRNAALPKDTFISSRQATSTTQSIQLSTEIVIAGLPSIPSEYSRTQARVQHESQVETASIDVAVYPTKDLVCKLGLFLKDLVAENERSNAEAIDYIAKSASEFATDPSKPFVFASDSEAEVDSYNFNSLFTAARRCFSRPNTDLGFVFSGAGIPSISLEAYMDRIHRYCPATNEAYISLPIYIERMSKLAKNINGNYFVVSSYNIHRIVLAGLLVATKFHTDCYYNTKEYAKTGGIPEEELRGLELIFLLLNNFDLFITPMEIQEFASSVIGPMGPAIEP